MFNYINGDIIELGMDRVLDFDAICCTTNLITNNKGELVMGAGVALAFKKKFAWLPKDWGKQVRDGYHNVLCDFSLYQNNPILVAFPTKKDWRDKSDINLIEKSCWELDIIANAIGWNKILLPKPGCLNGGLKWEKVKEILEENLTKQERYWIIDK